MARARAVAILGGLALFADWYGGQRPHAGPGGATPDKQLPQLGRRVAKRPSASHFPRP